MTHNSEPLQERVSNGPWKIIKQNIRLLPTLVLLGQYIHPKHADKSWLTDSSREDRKLTSEAAWFGGHIRERLRSLETATPLADPSIHPAAHSSVHPPPTQGGEEEAQNRGTAGRTRCED